MSHIRITEISGRVQAGVKVTGASKAANAAIRLKHEWMAFNEFWGEY